MRTVGIVCEYNPFHNGHRYHIARAKEELQCGATVCVMSGAWVQRGEAAMFDKWERARAALENGADLVLELPAYIALQSAEQFALGGIRILDALGVVDAVSFGSECGNLAALQDIAAVLADQPDDWRAALCCAMEQGMGYPAALGQAFAAVRPEIPLSALQGANNMLAAGYLAAIRRLRSGMQPHTVKRRTAGHHDRTVAGAFASGTAIRSAILEGREYRTAIPEHPPYSCTYRMERLEPMLLGCLRMADAARLDEIPGMEPGLANRMIAAAREATGWADYVNRAVTKRYTASRIRRQTIAAALGFRPDAQLDYIRVLGLNRVGAAVLRAAKSKSRLPIITKTADASVAADSMFCYESRATDLAALACDRPEKRAAGADYCTSPVMIK